MARRRGGSALIAAVAVMMGTVLIVAPARVDAAVTPRVQDPGAAAVIARYEARIPELMAEQHIPGLAVVVVDGDHVLWQQAFGHIDDGSSRPVTVDTIFSAESMSKVFTATAVMQAVQDGRLGLDVPITTYLPDFTVHSAFEAHPERKITLRMLLGHTAGFTHEAPLGNNYEPEPGTFDAHVRTISDTWLRFPVGSGYAYSNLGIDLAAYILERAYGEPFASVVHDLLLAPLGMDASTFDRARVRTTEDRAVGHSDSFGAQPVDIPMTGAGGLWTSAADLAKFLEFQLGDGTFDGHIVLDAAHMMQMRTIPAPHTGAVAGYALGVARTRFRPGGHNLDLFSHGGGGFGFLSDLFWVPQLQLGIALLTNSDTHDLQVVLAGGILRDLVTEPDSQYYHRMLAAPFQTDATDPDSKFVAPTDLSARIAAVAMPSSIQQSARWAGYAGYYRIGQPGAMSPDVPPSRFHVDSGVPYFDASLEGTVRHRLTEFQPGLFLAEDGETLDLTGPSPRWRGLDLNRVNDGPLPWQWALLALAAVAAGWWLVGGVVQLLHGRRHRGAASATAAAAADSSRSGAWRRLVAVVGSLGAIAALVTAAAIVALPGLVDVGFLGRLDTVLPIRLAFHLPLAVTLLAGGLAVLLAIEAIGPSPGPRVRPREAALLLALAALAIQLTSWHLVAWGF
jgi:CubicO group peptidase (beta-lactamase class C family)